MFKAYVKKPAKWVIVTLVLFFASIVLPIIYFFNSDINPKALFFDHSTKSIQNNGEVFGKFIAQENYLGTITVRFKKKDLGSGNSIFRIKNILDKDWYHTAYINASDYSALNLYPFGFPVIENSKGKTYEFEVGLLNNSGDEKLELSQEEPVLISQYKYPKKVLLNHPTILLDFIYKKITYYMNSKNSWKILTVFNLPLIFYMFYEFVIFRFIDKKYKKRFENHILFIFKPITIITLAAIFVDIFIIRKYSDIITVVLSLVWNLAVITYSYDARKSYTLALIFLIFCPFLSSAEMYWIGEKSAIWAYMMLVIGTFQSIIGISTTMQKFLKNNIVHRCIIFVRSVLLFTE